MKLQPKELLKFISLAEYKNEVYNCFKFDPDYPNASKDLKEFFNQPLWKILPNITEFHFHPFYITRCNTIPKRFKDTPNKFILFHEITEYVRDSANEIMLFDNVEHALEFLKYNPTDNHYEYETAT